MKRQAVISSFIVLTLSLFCGSAFAKDDVGESLPLPTTVENTPNVNVVKIPELIIKTYKREPVSVGHGGLYDASSNGSIRKDNLYTVPSNKILVIERVAVTAWNGYSGLCSDADFIKNNIYGRLVVESSDQSISRGRTRLNQDTSGSNMLSGERMTRIYALGGDIVSVVLDISGGCLESYGGNISFTGYLVPADSPTLSP